MAMSVGNGGKQRAEINITPLIDVLLVLLIIFMVIAPSNYRGLEALIPPQGDQAKPTPQTDLVITVRSDRTVRLNQEIVAMADLEKRLRGIFSGGPRQVVFVRGDKDLDFREIAEVIDIAKGVGLDRVALMSE